jgi:hypothetical protein
LWLVGVVALIGLLAVALRRRRVRLTTSNYGGGLRTRLLDYPREEIVLGTLAILLSVLVGLLVGHL